MRRPKFAGSILILLIVFLLGIPAIYNLPPVQERLGWRVAELFARFKYALSPPEQIVFVPEEDSMLSPQTASSRSTPPAPLSATTTQTPTAKQPASSPASPALTSIPKNIQLTGFQHEYQTWNNCGPATLAMALSYWDWEGDQRLIAAFTKLNPRDKNVMPYELAAYVEEETQLRIVSRVGGDVELLKRFIASGLPVIIEKGFEGRDFDGWMGHYVLATGYSYQDQTFTLQDSYYGPDQVMGYADLESYWRAFNFTYLVVYPSERQVEITAVLGSHSDEEYNYRYAAQKASDEIYTLTGRDQFFAWFNRGTNLVSLQDYAAAAAAYDQAFALYPSIPEKKRPWRVMWYQTGPYSAYYYSGRYQDVIELASITLDAMSEPVLEESYYWRALAREALGDIEGAIKDLRSALNYHPGFEPSLTRLEQLRFTP
ncbi:MAG: C39 family peptidase [Anaerolineales bacterium]|nr:C39 family peptidase [Anaerolineales bacterium]